MKKILVLDDEPARHVGFLRRLRDHTVVSVGNYKEAAQALRAGSPFDVLFLDHDLGERRNGADVVRFLVREIPREQWPKMVVIHSWNPFGAMRMRNLLVDAGIPTCVEPYSWQRCQV
jgi:CheY-like chemotaxis protein